MAGQRGDEAQTVDGQPNEPPHRVGLTGADRFLGRHVLLALNAAGCEVRTADDDTLASPPELARFVRDCDTLVHLAGNDFLAPEESARKQIGHAWSLVWACEAVRASPNLITTSPVTRSEETRLVAAAANEAGCVLMDWARRNGVSATTLQVPEVYGPGVDATSRSVVDGLCRGALAGRAAATEATTELELLWVGDLADEIVDYVQFPSDETGSVRLYGELEATADELVDELAILKSTALDQCLLPDNSDEARRTLGITLAASRCVPIAGRSKILGAGQLAGLPQGTATQERFHTRTLHRIFVDRGGLTLRYRPMNSTETADISLSHDGLNACLLPPFMAYSLLADPNHGAELVVSAVRAELDQGHDLHATERSEEHRTAIDLETRVVKKAA